MLSFCVLIFLCSNLSHWRLTSHGETRPCAIVPIGGFTSCVCVCVCVRACVRACLCAALHTMTSPGRCAYHIHTGTASARRRQGAGQCGRLPGFQGACHHTTRRR